MADFENLTITTNSTDKSTKAESTGLANATVRASQFRQAYSCNSATGVCVRIDSHRRRVEATNDLESLTKIISDLDATNLLEDDEFYLVRGTNKEYKKNLKQLLKEANQADLKPFELERKIGAIKSAVLAQLVQEKKERVDAIIKELKTALSNDKLSDEEKSEELRKIIRKAAVQGLISEDQQISLMESLKDPDGLVKTFETLSSTLGGISAELARKRTVYRSIVELSNLRLSKSEPSNAGDIVLMVANSVLYSTANMHSSGPGPVKTFSADNSYLHQTPVRSKYLTQIIESLEGLSEAKRRLEKLEDAKELENDEIAKKELDRIREIFRELIGEIPGIRISDIQVVLSSLERLPRYAIVQIIMDIKAAFS